MIEHGVTWGNLLTIASVIFAALGLFWKITVAHAENQSRIAIIETRVDAIWRWFIDTDRRSPRDLGG